MQRTTKLALAPLAIPLLAQPCEAVDRFTAIARATTSQQHRGLTLSAGRPSISLAGDIAFLDHWYAGVQGATIKLPSGPGRGDRNVEMLSYFGRSFSLPKQSRVSTEIVRYDYPDEPGLGYTEFTAGWHLADAFSALASYAPNALGVAEPGYSVEVVGRRPLTKQLSWDARVGTYQLSPEIWPSYGWWSIGVGWQRRPWGADLRVEGTVGDTSNIFGSRGDTRVVLSVTFAR